MKAKLERGKKGKCEWKKVHKLYGVLLHCQVMLLKFHFAWVVGGLNCSTYLLDNIEKLNKCLKCYRKCYGYYVREILMNY